MKLNAFILMKVDLGCESKILRALEAIPGLDNAFYVFGDYDMIATVSTNSIEGLTEVVSKIRRVGNVKSTSTMIAREL